MKACPADDHKHNGVCAGRPDNSRGGGLSRRPALILALAGLTALVGAGLMRLSHRPDAQIGLSAPGIFVMVKPRSHDDRNGACAARRDKSRGRILSVRSALIIALAVLTALIGAGLMGLGHRPDAQIALGAPGIFAVATVFYGRVIDRD